MRQLPEFLKRYRVTRFDTCQLRHTGAARTLYDYLAAVAGESRLPPEKIDAPAWALCNDTGTNDGEANGLIQLDFDHVTDVGILRSKLIEYGGFLAVVKTWSGQGLVAIGDAGKRLAGDREALKTLIYAPLKTYLHAAGLTDGEDYVLDDACAKTAQLRFESRDPGLYVAPARCVLACDWQDEGPLLRHPVAMLADALRPGETCQNAGLAAALASVGMCADVKSRLYAGAMEYPARAFCVLVMPPGGMKTTLLEAVQDHAQSLGVTLSDPKNAPTLREHILLCGCDDVAETTLTETGKPKTVVKRVERAGAPDSLMVVIDEAGQRLKSRVQDESFGSMAAMLRQCNGARVTVESTVKQERKGSYRVPAHVTALLASTPDQWADYIAAAAQTNGEARRMIEFWQDVEDRDMFSAACDRHDSETAGDILHTLREMADLWRDKDVVFTPDVDARTAFRTARAQLIQAGADAPTADSLIMVYSTLCAALRASIDGKAGRITCGDLAACMCVLRRVFESRERIRTICEARETSRYKPEAVIWQEIVRWIEQCPRRDKIVERLARKPPAYRRVYDEMIQQRAVTVVKDDKSSRYLLQLASASDLEQAEEARAAVKTETKAAGQKPVGYAEASEDDKESRVLAYIQKWRENNDLAEGNRNIALNRLAFMLQKAGMWDATAQTVFQIVSRNTGLPEDEIRLLMRERKK